MRSVYGITALSLALIACGRGQSIPTVALRRPAPPADLARADELSSLALIPADSLSHPTPDHAHNPGRHGVSVATCEPLFFDGAQAWTRQHLSPTTREAWDAYCGASAHDSFAHFGLPSGLFDVDERRQISEQAAQRSANREAALRALEREAAGAAPSPSAMLAMGYLLTEKAYEEARSAAWSCRFCELGPPNAFSREAFIESLRQSKDFRRAVQSFDEASKSAEATGWLASFFAMSARRDLGPANATLGLARLFDRALPPGVGGAVLLLARVALDERRPDLANNLLRHVADDGTPGARLWLRALERRWDEVLRVAVAILAKHPFSIARDVPALGALAVEHQGLGDGAGARDGEARIALALAERALAARNVAGARRWLDWIHERAPDSACAPAALEATAMLAEHEGDQDSATRARAAMSDRYGLGSAWEDALRARLEARVAALIVRDPSAPVRGSWPVLLRALER